MDTLLSNPWSIGIISGLVALIVAAIFHSTIQRRIGNWWGRIRRTNKQSLPTGTKTLTYSREQLVGGVKVYVPPAAALEIPLVVEKGEVIWQIQINSSEVQGAMEHYIDSLVLDSSGKEVLRCSRNMVRVFGGVIPTGQYTLRLSNEYQPLYEKQVLVRVYWKPSSEVKPSIINGRSITP